MSSPLAPLLTTNLRSWLSAKGFWLVAAAALLPLVLTGAWVATHRADVAASGLEVPASIEEGDNVTFKALVSNAGSTHVGPFNATIAVGTVSGGALFPLGSQTTTIDGLDPGATREVTLSWTATPGTLFVVAFADQEDVLREIDEYDNQDAKPIAVGYKAGGGTGGPTPPGALAGDANATTEVDLAVTAVRFPAAARPGDNVTLAVDVVNNGNATVQDANVTLRIGRSFGEGAFFPATSTTSPFTFEPGQTQTLQLAWTATEGAWYAEAWAEPPAGAREATPADNHKAEPFGVSPTIPADFQAPEIPEKLTIKEFYLNVLTLLHLRILLPMIALFYAAGVITDERDRGALPYLLTRPLPRWLIPITKFAASFVVASLAAVVGLVLTYLLLFGATPEGGDVGFLVTPILAALLTLFVYGALFILLGVWVARPYLVGVAFVLGWENFANIFVPWVRNLTLTQHLSNAIAGWPLDQGATWLPTTDQGMQALLLLLAVGVGLLVAASAAMKRREFEV